MQEVDRLYRDCAPRLRGLAFQVLGQWHAAEEAVEEAFARFLELPRSRGISDPAHWLEVVTARVALDLVRSADRSRVDYVGPWLPEIAVKGRAFLGEAHDAAAANDPALFVESAENVDLALARLVQTLEPMDRVVFVLVEAFGFSSGEVAECLGLTSAAVRARMKRSRARLRRGEGLPTGTGHESEINGAVRLLSGGDIKGFARLLSDDAVLWVDSGGLSKAARRPIMGAEKIERFLAGLFRKYGTPRFTVCDGVGGVVVVAESSDMVRAVAFEFVGQKISGVQVQQNPGKIRFE